MTSRTTFAATLVAAGAFFSVTAAQASSDCHGSACYRLVKTAPTFETVSREVLVKPGRTVAEHIPAQFGQVNETVMVRPARVVTRHIPAVYGTTAETVMVEPARKVWQVSIDAHGQKVGCWVDIPARFATRHRQVVIREASVSHETIPAQYAHQSRTVMVREASVRHHHVAPVYGVQHHQVMVHPGSKHWAPVRGF